MENGIFEFHIELIYFPEREREREKRKERKFNIPFLHPCKSCRYPVSIFRVPILTIPRAWFTESLDFDDNEFPHPLVPSPTFLLLLLCNHPPPIFLTESRLAIWGGKGRIARGKFYICWRVKFLGNAWNFQGLESGWRTDRRFCEEGTLQFYVLYDTNLWNFAGGNRKIMNR